MLVLSFKECCISSITNVSSAVPSLFYKHSTHTQAEFGTESVIYAQSLLICVGRWQSAEAKKYSEKRVKVKPLDVFNVAAGSWTVYTINAFLNG